MIYALMDLSTLLIAGGLCGLFVCGGYILLHVFDRYGAAVEARLHEIPRAGSPMLKRDPGMLRAKARGVMNQLVPGADQERQRHQSRLLKAGIYSPTALSTFFALKLILMMSPPVVGLVVGWVGLADQGNCLLFGCIAGGFGMIVPSFWLDRQIRQRHLLLRRGLPDFLDLMTVCLQGGLSLQGTLQRVSDELRLAHPVLAWELSIVQRDIELGMSAHGAIRRFADRTGFDGVRQLSSLISDAQRHGAELSDALRVHADTLRSQREAEAEETAQKAAVKILIPTLLFIFPAVFVVLAGPAAIRIHESLTKPGAKAVRAES